MQEFKFILFKLIVFLYYLNNQILTVKTSLNSMSIYQKSNI